MKKPEPIESKLPKRQAGKLNYYFHVSENSGVGYYRQFLPAETLQKHNLANVLISDFRWGDGNHEEPDMDRLFEIANWADVIIVGRKDIAQFYAMWGGIREFFNMPIIIDTDDNVQAVRPSNPGYTGYAPGSEALIWNRYAAGKIFDAITVTTEPLKKLHEKDSPRIYILPNCLDVKHWKSLPRNQWMDGYTTIAFIGSAAHSEGIEIIKKPVVEIMRKYPKVKFLVTHVYQRFFKEFKDIADRIEYVPWIHLKDWPANMKKLGIDIGLAPLADNEFNRSKSNLRWMEFSLAGQAVIASPVFPYKNSIEHGKTGYLASERSDWFKCMEELILDPHKRMDIAQAALEDVSTRFDIDKNIGMWDAVYREVHQKFHDFWGPKKRFVAEGKGKFKQIGGARKSLPQSQKNEA